MIVTGCNTSGCIRGTALDSFSLRYRTLVPEDCVGDIEEGPHRDNLRDLGRMLSTATFTEADGRTTIRLEWTTLDATAPEQKVFDDSHGSMQGGWTGTLDQFEAYLAKTR